jgi:hypothetical protein
LRRARGHRRRHFRPVRPRDSAPGAAASAASVASSSSSALAMHRGFGRPLPPRLPRGGRESQRGGRSGRTPTTSTPRSRAAQRSVAPPDRTLSPSPRPRQLPGYEAPAPGARRAGTPPRVPPRRRPRLPRQPKAQSPRPAERQRRSCSTRCGTCIRSVSKPQSRPRCTRFRAAQYERKVIRPRLLHRRPSVSSMLLALRRVAVVRPRDPC